MKLKFRVSSDWKILLFIGAVFAGVTYLSFKIPSKMVIPSENVTRTSTNVTLRTDNEDYNPDLVSAFMTASILNQSGNE